jgi:3-hydroxyacyl-CoA dehydrogenase/3a,7a,12a-trihydroxy-5b-cholest-24-enoyl-CoA hydratase
VWVEQHPELADKIKKVFLFKLTDPQSAWTLDLKTGGGRVFEGDVEKPDCTLEITEADFIAMTKGEANPQKLYFGGKLKISGDVMASQRLDFLQKIDAAAVADEVAKRKAAGGGQAAAATAAAPSRGATAPKLFASLKSRLADNPKLADDVQALIQFQITGPDASWVVDLARGPGDVREGVAENAKATFTLEDEDLEALAKGAASPQDLHQRGRLRIDGEMTVAHRLGFLKQLA